jgi:cobalt-zinc-cadmium efflux system membrane fusion protein
MHTTKMIEMVRAIAVGLAATVLAAGCSRKPVAEKTEKSADTMQAMTGGTAAKEGAMPTTLTMTAAQVAHGKVAWSAVAMSMTSIAATVPGQITTDEDHTVRLGAPARGRVTTVSVNPGDRVRRGQVLAALQSADAAAAQSDVAKATAMLSSRRAQAAYAKAAKERADRLLALKAIPRQEYDRAVADDELAQSEVRQSEAELQRARTLADQLGADATGGGTIVLRSPQDGIVLSRNAVPGTVVEAGAPLIVVTDPARLWLIVNAPEQFAGLFRSGGQLRFVVPAYADTFTARISAVGAGLDQETRTLQVRGIADSRGGRLKSGMLATVAVSGARQTPAAVLPDDAVQLLQGKPNIFIAVPDGKGGARITRREVELGSRGNGQVAVVHGLNAGDVVVTSGAFAVKAEFQKSGLPKMEM